MKKTGAVLVAAGLSSRMKDFKPMLPFGTSTASRHMIGMLKSLKADPIVVVTGYRAEELEAHLHPQYLLRLIDYISSQQNNEQFILSTHSITLASKIRLENLIILKDKEAYPMSADYTMMNPAQYLSGTLLPLFDKNEVTVVANTFFNAVADGNQGGQNLEHGNIYKEDDMEIEIATVHAVKG